MNENVASDTQEGAQSNQYNQYINHSLIILPGNQTHQIKLWTFSEEHSKLTYWKTQTKETQTQPDQR